MILDYDVLMSDGSIAKERRTSCFIGLQFLKDRIFGGYCNGVKIFDPISVTWYVPEGVVINEQYYNYLINKFHKYLLNPDEILTERKVVVSCDTPVYLMVAILMFFRMMYEEPSMVRFIVGRWNEYTNVNEDIVFVLSHSYFLPRNPNHVVFYGLFGEEMLKRFINLQYDDIPSYKVSQKFNGKITHFFTRDNKPMVLSHFHFDSIANKLNMKLNEEEAA